MANEAAAKLLDLSQPIDVTLLDATVGAFYGAGSNEEVCDGLCWGAAHMPWKRLLHHRLRSTMLNVSLGALC